MLLDGSDTGGQAATALVQQHRRPRPHVPEANILVAAGVGVAMDVSDGLADDLGKLCSSSGVSARILLESVPVPEALREIFPDQWQRLALYGGEDYVLMFTAPPDVMALAVNSLPSAAIIGEITSGAPGQVTIIDTGWDIHIAPRVRLGPLPLTRKHQHISLPSWTPSPSTPTAPAKRGPPDI